MMKVLALVAAIFTIAAAQQRCGTWKCQQKLMARLLEVCRMSTCNVIIVALLFKRSSCARVVCVCVCVCACACAYSSSVLASQ